MDFDELPISVTDPVAEVVNLYPEAEAYLASLGMHCVGCAAADFESVADACRAHGLRPAEVVRTLNRLVTGEE